ncbi:cytochrome O ubiquinol oxidase [Stenotrophomonas ginsengisoli]|uniref:Ubiquinol oxidase subunit 2 n=1 Tax=Stenotrophomonas ginsengisoli TaxID=336566 RepID=A0A0R0D7M3_9GAMM|nr:ubiquinol oxidase subunit II [Stenotrophomonas ginsengisoli]KRG74466.1 cytochrome O ubiquinol oxidase [Stenotrophomonas ginsengisoli]
MIPLKTLGRLLRPGLLVAMAVLMTGCDWALFDPKGQVAREELTLLITCTVLMLLVVIPVIVMTLVFAWKYRASNTNARYEPEWSHSTAIEVVVWSIPCMIVTALAVLCWKSSHELDPYKPIEHEKPGIEIQAVSLDWKWLFVYPEEKVAVVNELTFPVDTPLNFRITADTVMNVFFIPHLGSMIYSMAGMETKLHLIADQTGTFPGRSAHYSGYGFNKMYFDAHSVSDAEYQQWLAKVRADGKTMDQAAFTAIGAEKNHDWYPVTYYSNVEDGLFDWVINKHMGDNHHFGMKADAHAAAGHGSHDAHAAPAVEQAPADQAPVAGQDVADDAHAGHTADEHAAHAGHGVSGE